MRTTLNLNDELLAAAKRRAAQRGQTLTAFIEGALAAALAPERHAKRFKLRLPTVKGEYVAGVDVANRDALYDVMEGRRR